MSTLGRVRESLYAGRYAEAVELAASAPSDPASRESIVEGRFFLAITPTAPIVTMRFCTQDPTTPLLTPPAQKTDPNASPASESLPSPQLNHRQF